jgi:hypothetical protein
MMKAIKGRAAGLVVAIALCIAQFSISAKAGERGGFDHRRGGSTLSDSAREDLGDLREAQDRGLLSHFRANVQLNTQFVSNAALRGNHGSGDFIFNPVGEVGFNAPLGHGFTLDMVGRLETVVYSRFNERSFWGYSGAATLEWQMRRWPQFFVSVEPYRFADFSGADTIAEAVGISEGVDHSIVINKGRSLLFGGYAFTSYFATPAADNRDTHRLLVGITHQLTPRLFAQIYYSWEYLIYQEYDRQDSRNVGGLSLIYRFGGNLFGNIGANLVDNDSNVGLGNYQNFILRSGLNLQF